MRLPKIAIISEKVPSEKKQREASDIHNFALDSCSSRTKQQKQPNFQFKVQWVCMVPPTSGNVRTWC